MLTSLAAHNNKIKIGLHILKIFVIFNLDRVMEYPFFE